MIDPKLFDDIAKRISEAIPESVRGIGKDFERNVRGILQSTFVKMDLVTREEFDVQAKVLARTREKIEALTEQVSYLEEQINQSPPKK